MDLNDPKNCNRWIVGVPPQVPESSPFYSEQLQISYSKKLEKESEHWHTFPIEEYYLVLQGSLRVKVEDEIVNLRPMQLLAIPSRVRHKILDYAPDSEWFIIRAPISRKNTKVQIEG